MIHSAALWDSGMAWRVLFWDTNQRSTPKSMRIKTTCFSAVSVIKKKLVLLLGCLITNEIISVMDTYKTWRAVSGRKKKKSECNMCVSVAVFVCRQCVLILICSVWHICTFLSSFSGAEGKCLCKHSCCLRGRSFSHLSPPRISQSVVTAPSMPPLLPRVIPFSPSSFHVISRLSPPLPLDAHTHIQVTSGAPFVADRC